MTQAFYIGSQLAITQATQAVRELKPFSKLIVEIKPLTRSNAQNRLYWGWIKEISDHTGYEKDDLHLMFREEILPQVLGEASLVTVFNRKYMKEQSTTHCNTKQFTEYLERIERFANTEIGITLSHPDDLFQEAMGRARNVPK